MCSVTSASYASPVAWALSKVSVAFHSTTSATARHPILPGDVMSLSSCGLYWPYRSATELRSDRRWWVAYQPTSGASGSSLAAPATSAWT
jgi:hypothetical protein